MENAILARQQKRQGLLLHLGGHDIANLLSPENEEIPVAASTRRGKDQINGTIKEWLRGCGVHLCRTWSGTRPAQTSRRVAAAAVTAAARCGRRRRRRVNGPKWVPAVRFKMVVGSGGA
jgi:hypothetical protein